jgi:hypothetical protein
MKFLREELKWLREGKGVEEGGGATLEGRRGRLGEAEGGLTKLHSKSDDFKTQVAEMAGRGESVKAFEESGRNAEPIGGGKCGIKSVFLNVYDSKNPKKTVQKLHQVLRV